MRLALALIRGTPIPLRRQRIVALHSLAALIEAADLFLRRGIAGLSQRLQDGEGLVPFAEAIGIEAVFERAGLRRHSGEQHEQQ